MELEYDEAKNQWNIRERGLSFERVTDFDFASADIKQVTRRGELRLTAVGYLDDVLHMLRFVLRGLNLRVISFRVAGRKERRDYEESHKQR